METNSDVLKHNLKTRFSLGKWTVPMLMVLLGLMAGTLHCQVMQQGWEVRGGVSADSRSEISSSAQGSDTSWTAAVLAGDAAFMDTSAQCCLSGLVTVLNCGGWAGLMGTSVQSSSGAGLMGTSVLLRRQGLRKASRSGSSGTSGLLTVSQSGLRAHSGLMGTLQTCFWSRSGLEGLSRSSMIAKGSLLGLTELSGLAGGSGLVYTSQLGAVVLETEDPVGQAVWSLKDSTAGGGGCTMVVEEAVVRERWAEASPSPTMVPCL